MKNKKLLIIIAAVLITIAVLTWAFIESTKPLPGVAQLQPGRNHLDLGAPTPYQFNPPTSGNHYPSWITKGFYDTPRADGYVVHSQEHGYIIFWYDCEKPLAADLIPAAYAAEIASPAANATTDPFTDLANRTMAGGSEGSPSASLASMPKSFSDGSCDTFKNQLKDLYNQFGQHKLIFMPRLGMDSPLILTAWGRSEKLTKIDKSKIGEFINVFRDKGPEQTTEP